LAINIEGKIGQLTVRRTSSFTIRHIRTFPNSSRIGFNFYGV
jgi:hypothetical protein